VQTVLLPRPSPIVSAVVESACLDQKEKKKKKEKRGCLNKQTGSGTLQANPNLSLT
jgi:hypothetical protein